MLVSSKLCSFAGCKNVVHGGDYRCEQHPVTYSPKRKYDHHYHKGQHIYKSARWTKIRKQFLSKYPLCQSCERFGIYTTATVLDHIKEIKDLEMDSPLVWDTDNMQGLCHSCHNRKTADEAKRRRREFNRNGFKALSSY